MTKSSAARISVKCGRAKGTDCTAAQYSVRSGRTRNTPGSLNSAGSSTPAEVMPRPVEIYSPQERAAPMVSEWPTVSCERPQLAWDWRARVFLTHGRTNSATPPLGHAARLVLLPHDPDMALPPGRPEAQ